METGEFETTVAEERSYAISDANVTFNAYTCLRFGSIHTATGKWRCTDIGIRVIVAIHLNQEDFRNYNGPPYSIPEDVFDEYDMEGCSLDSTEFEDAREDIPSIL